MFSYLWRNSARPQKTAKARRGDGGATPPRRRSRERPSVRFGGGLKPAAATTGYCDNAPDARRTQTTLIRTRDSPMAYQCDAEAMRASRARGRSQRPGQQSARPVLRPVRTKATGEASKPGSCCSNVAGRHGSTAMRACWRPYFASTRCTAVHSTHTSTVGSNSGQQAPAASLRPSSSGAGPKTCRGKIPVALYGTSDPRRGGAHESPS